MDVKTLPNGRVVPFQRPKEFLADLDPRTASEIVCSAADVALVVEKGVIQDVAIGNPELSTEGFATDWPGRNWSETVTEESRPKIEAILTGAETGDARWRHVNHPTSTALDLPVRYTAVSMRHPNRVIALGRDLRAMSNLQQRLIEAHQDLERDYSRLREAEARYKLLFESSSEAVLVANADTLRIEEANPAAGSLLDSSVDILVHAALQDIVASQSQRAVERATAEAVTVGASRLSGVVMIGGSVCDLSASAFRQNEAHRLIVRLRANDNGEAAVKPTREPLLEVMEAIPDGLIVAALDLRILAANRAFLEMTHLSGQPQLEGTNLSQFLGRSTVDLNLLVSTLRTHGSIRNFATVLRDRFGAEETVEVSAVAAPTDAGQAFGFSIRNVARRLKAGGDLSSELPRSVDQLTSLVGRVPLKDIVRESTDLIEKLCIEAALEITSDNRASAAEMLGLSRQGLYTKLKRFGIDDKS
ncbi:MAG: transcriptional regulator PpsR [Pseudomonadota bacterium]